MTEKKCSGIKGSLGGEQENKSVCEDGNIA